DFCWRVKLGWVIAILKIALATRFNYLDVAFHHHVFRACELFDRGAPGAVIVMGVTDEQNLDVAELETQRLHTLPDHWHVSFEIAIDQNVSLVRGDQITRESP